MCVRSFSLDTITMLCLLCSLSNKLQKYAQFLIKLGTILSLVHSYKYRTKLMAASPLPLGHEVLVYLLTSYRSRRNYLATMIPKFEGL
jgi:hypothetical protein